MSLIGQFGVLFPQHRVGNQEMMQIDQVSRVGPVLRLKPHLQHRLEEGDVLNIKCRRCPQQLAQREMGQLGKTGRDTRQDGRMLNVSVVGEGGERVQQLDQVPDLDLLGRLAEGLEQTLEGLLRRKVLEGSKVAKHKDRKDDGEGRFVFQVGGQRAEELDGQATGLPFQSHKGIQDLGYVSGAKGGQEEGQSGLQRGGEGRREGDAQLRKSMQYQCELLRRETIDVVVERFQHGGTDDRDFVQLDPDLGKHREHLGATLLGEGVLRVGFALHHREDIGKEGDGGRDAETGEALEQQGDVIGRIRLWDVGVMEER